MSLLSWNCRGLGNPQTVNALKKVIRIEKPNFVFLMETKSDEEWVMVVRDRCEYKNSFVVPSNGLSGGLALFWKADIKVSVQGSSLSHIDAIVEGGGSNNPWHLTGFYGNPVTSLRSDSWRLLSSLCNGSNLPWLVIGDFNEIMCDSEKEGGAKRSNAQMLRFKNTVEACGLSEICFNGPLFTWIYQRRDGFQIRERLDRALASTNWALLFPSAKLYHKSTSTSDHSPLLLKFCASKKKSNHKRVFRFESMWLRDQSCEKVISEAWNEGQRGDSAFTINACLDLCRSRLEAWNSTEFGHVGKKISLL